ncbi:hypothetical protein ABT147_42165 [Streptomyces sp. NPDC001868]|uniref:hypothetical protein n=1 Tax=Streptomyces sp. NPDC001868 TaxID=3154401 RepID=UPI003321DCF7
MRLEELPWAPLRSGAEDLAALAQAVVTAEGDEITVPGGAALGLAAASVRSPRADIDAVREPVRVLREGILPLLDDRAQDAHDLRLLFGALRDILEALLREPLRAPGEDRAGAVTEAKVEQTVRRVRGRLTGVRAPRAASLVATIRQDVTVVESGGSVTGLELFGDRP